MLLVVLTSGTISFNLLEILSAQRQKEQQLLLQDKARTYGQAIEHELIIAVSSAYSVAAWLKKRELDLTGFQDFAEQILVYYPYLTAVSIAPAGVVSNIHPITENRNLVGFDIINDPDQGPAAKRAITNRTLQLTGPYQLNDKNAVVIGRLPIFLDNAANAPFWGFVSITLQLENLTSMLPLTKLPEVGIDYILYLERNFRQENPLFIGSIQTPAADFVKSDIFPESTGWSLHLYPEKGWRQPQIYYYQAFLGTMFTILLALLSFFWMNTLRRKTQLAKMVALKTKDLAAQVARNRSFIIASNSASWEYDHVTGKTTQSPEYLTMLGYPANNDNFQKGLLEDLWVKHLHPDDQEHATKVFWDYLNDDNITFYENQFRMRHNDGHWLWVLARGRTIQVGEQLLTVGIHLDITQRKKNELQLQLMARLYQQSSEGLMITNNNADIIQVNQAFCTINGYKAEEVIGKKPSILSSGRHDIRFYQKMWRTIAETGSWKGEIWNRRKNGNIFPEWLSISKVEGFEPGEFYYIGLFSDISQYKTDEAQIRFLAEFDPLTSLPNRVLLLERTEQALKRCQVNKQSLAMMVIDLDRFKHINDSLGHQIGDEVLVQFARRLSALSRAEDTLSRLSSDEFVIIRQNCNANDAANFAERVLPELLKPCMVAEHELILSASIGIAISPNDGQNYYDLYRHADIAMYKAKELGRNTYCFFTSAMQTFHARHLILESALRRAIEHNELHLAFQPQYCLTRQQLLGFEVLLRWRHPEFGLVSPAEFIPLAERSGFIVAIGYWVLQNAIKQLAQWREQGFVDFILAINLSPVQFRQPNLLLSIKQLLKDYQVPATAVELEITESAMMDDPEQASVLIKQFSQLGLHTAVDDFGTGYSSLSYLKSFPLTKLKIDQSFIRNILTDRDDKAIVSAIINIAKSMSFITIAEGVETQEQQCLLKQMGCDEIQGYFYSKPLNTDNASRFLQEHSLNTLKIKPA